MGKLAIEQVTEPVYRCPVCGFLSVDKQEAQDCMIACLAKLEKVLFHEGDIVGTNRTDDFDQYRVLKVQVEQGGLTRHVRVFCHNISKGEDVVLPEHIVKK